MRWRDRYRKVTQERAAPAAMMLRSPRDREGVRAAADDVDCVGFGGEEDDKDGEDVEDVEELEERDTDIPDEDDDELELLDMLPDEVGVTTGFGGGLNTLDGTAMVAVSLSTGEEKLPDIPWRLKRQIP